MIVAPLSLGRRMEGGPGKPAHGGLSKARGSDHIEGNPSQGVPLNVQATR
jgi:hypothetical protein